MSHRPSKQNRLEVGLGRAHWTVIVTLTEQTVQVAIQKRNSKAQWLNQKALIYLSNKLRPRSDDFSEMVSLEYLRHNRSCYHLMLASQCMAFGMTPTAGEEMWRWPSPLAHFGSKVTHSLSGGSAQSHRLKYVQKSLEAISTKHIGHSRCSHISVKAYKITRLCPKSECYDKS